MKIEGSENSEEKFKNFWRHRATRWLEEIDASLMDPVSKIRLKSFIDINFLKGYINNPKRPSVNIFLNAINEEMGTNVQETSEDSEKEDEKRIYKMIKDEVSKLLIDPKNN